MGAVPLGEAGVDRVRAFFGLPLPEEYQEALGQFLVARHVLNPKFRWTRPENLHITIRFLGQVPEPTAQAIADLVEAGRPPGFAIELGEPGAFSRGKMARVLWLGLKLGQAEVSALAARVEEACAEQGLEAERRPYHPHLTLARSRQLQGAQPPHFTPPDLPPWRADELVLFRSRLGGHSGPVYERMRTIRLS